MTNKLRLTVLLAAMIIFCSSAKSEDLPESGLLVRIKANDIMNNSDAFLSSIRNEQKTSISVQQTEVSKRPLYIKDYAQAQSAISVAEARSIRLRPIDKPSEFHLIIGYYTKQYEDEFPHFNIVNFTESNLANSRDGFSFVFENRSLLLSGEPGYDCAITELLYYNRKLSIEEMEEVLGYLDSTYYIRTDPRYANNGIKIDTESLFGVSNLLRLSDQTLLCFGVKEEVRIGIEHRKLETIRSYDSGNNWSSTSSTLNRAIFYKTPSVSLFQLDSSNTFAIILAKDKLSDLPPLEQESDNPEFYNGIYISRSIDEGFGWSEMNKIESSVEIANVESISQSCLAGGNLYLLLERKGNVPILMSAPAYTSSVVDSKSWRYDPLSQVLEIPPSITIKESSFNIGTDGENLYITCASERGHLLLAESPVPPTPEAKVKVNVCRYPDDNYLLSGDVKKTFINTSNKNGKILLSQVQKGKKGAYVLLATEAEDGKWNQPELVLYSPNSENNSFSLIEMLGLDNSSMMFYKSSKTARIQHEDDNIASFLSRKMSLRTSNNLILEIGKGKIHKKKTVQADRFSTPGVQATGLTIDIFAETSEKNCPEDIVVFNKDKSRNITVSRVSKNVIEFSFSKSQKKTTLTFNSLNLEETQPNHISLIVDYAAEYVYATINGQIVMPTNTDYHIYDLRVQVENAWLAKGFKGTLETVRVYDAPLKTAEVLRNPI